MPRAARTKSSTGFYHVLLRGKSKQNLFEDDKDRERFIETIARYKNQINFEIHSYCLMGNHVQLLIEDSACLDVTENIRLTDEKAIEIIKGKCKN